MDPTKRVTAADVANAAGVSSATASYVLSGSRLDKVSVQTQERVRQAANELGYRPNRVARGLKTRRSYAIGVISTSIRMPLFGDAIQQSQGVVADYGFHVVLHNVGFSQAREKDALRFMEELCIDGAIFLSSSHCTDNDHLAEFAQRTPLVLVNRYVPAGFPVSTVRVSHEEAGYQAAQHLIGLGRRHFAIVGTSIEGPNRSLAALGRYNGFRRAVTEAGLPWEKVTVHIEQRLDTLIGYRAVSELLSQQSLSEQKPDGIYMFNDYGAAGAVRALLEAGMSVPDDVAVVGNDDTELASRFIPTLTSINQRFGRAGRIASELLLAQIENSQSKPVEQVISPDLIVRESTVGGRPPWKQERKG